MKRVKFSSTFGWKPPVLRRLYLCASSGVGAPSGAGPSAAPPVALPSPAPSAPAPAAPSAPAAAPTGPQPPVATIPPSGVPPASPTGPGPTNGPLPANDANLAVLRQSHEQFTAFRTEAQQLATDLGFTPESFEAAFTQDPIDTLAFLRSEQHKASANAPQLDPATKSLLDQRLGPLEQQLRLQQVEKANGVVDGELSRVFGEHAIFKGKTNVPPEASNFIQDLTREILKYDQAGLRKIMSGDISPVKLAFDTAIDRFFKAVNAYTQWQGNGGAPPAGPSNQPNSGPTQPPQPGWSLSDLINGDEKAFQGLGTTRR